MSKALRKLNNILMESKKKKYENQASEQQDTLTIEEVIKRYEALIS